MLDSKRPLDKIYGLYSILTSYCDVSLSAPDYDETTEEVYEETASSWINSRGDMDILKLAGRPDLDHKLPSWVPAWDQAHPRAIRNPGESPETPLFWGSRHFKWNHRFKVNRSTPETSSGPWKDGEDTFAVASVISPGKLYVFQARVAGRVSQAVGPNRSHGYEWYWNSADGLYVHFEWCAFIRDVFSHDHIYSEEALRETFRSLLMPGIHKFGPRFPGDTEELFESFRAWLGLITYLQDAFESPDSICSGETDADQWDLVVRFYFNVCRANEKGAVEQLQNGHRGEFHERESLIKLARHIKFIADYLVYMRNHRLCILDNDNMIAVTDFWCQEGNDIFVFPGTDCPFVLRRAPDGECYRLVGPALVDRLWRVGYQKWRSEGDDLQEIVLI